MAQKVRIWFDKEGDFLEVLFSDEPLSAELAAKAS